MVFAESTGQDDFENVVREYSYRVQAGSARKPNKNNRIRALNEWGQSALPVIQAFAMQGMVEPWNAYVNEIAKAMDFEAAPFLLQPPQQQEGPPPPDPEEVRKEASHQQDMRHSEEKHQQNLSQAEEMGKVKKENAKKTKK